MRIRPPVVRRFEIQRLRERLELREFPRLQMMLLVAITAAAGFLASWLMRRAGLDTAWLRALLAVGVAYVAFLGLLWVWLHTRDDRADITDLLNAPSPSGSGGHAAGAGYPGHGGGFGGGGAGSSFDASGGAHAGSALDAGPLGEAAGHTAAAGEYAVPLFVLALFALLAFSVVMVVWSAPTLFAELLFDGVVAAGIYHRLRKADRVHWLETAVKHTAWPFAVVAVAAALLGMVRGG